MSTEATLQDLRARHDALQIQLTNMQIQHQTMDALHTQQYRLSIEDSIKALFEVIAYVRKADKTLVEWHHRSAKLKRALRLFGVDRRTSTVIAKKTTKLKARISVVESKFDGANDTVANGLRATQGLKEEFVEFSSKALDPMARQTVEAREVLDSSHEVIEDRIGEQRMLHWKAENRVREASETLSKTMSEKRSAEGAQVLMTAGSIMGFGLAGAAAVLFPPSLLMAGATMAAGAGAGTLASMACAANEGIRKLQIEQERLAALLKPHENAIQALQRELSGLNLRREELADAIRLVEGLNTQTSIFRNTVQDNVDYMRQTKLCLDRTRLKLMDIIRKLHECQYEETRRSIAVRLREVLTTIQTVPTKKLVAIEPVQMSKAMKYLTDIDNRTGEVVKILTAA